MVNKNNRGPEDRLFQVDNRQEFEELLFRVASNANEIGNPVGLIAILRSQAEYLCRNLVNIGGYDIEGARVDSWECVWEGFSEVIDRNNALLKPEIAGLIFEKEDEVFAIDDAYRSQMDTTGVQSFYRHFGAVAMSQYE